jgi:hypothetical protein
VYGLVGVEVEYTGVGVPGRRVFSYVNGFPDDMVSGKMFFPLFFEFAG